jgi:excisionase family DNA binding protein
MQENPCLILRARFSRMLVSFVALVSNISINYNAGASSYTSDTAMNTKVRPELPTAGEVTLAKESSRLLSLYLSGKEETQSILVIDEAGERDAVQVPTAAFRLLIDILSEMAQGNAVSLIPVHAELTTQEAADMLNVSRPHLVKLLDGGAIPFHKVGAHRRVRYQDLVDYKNGIQSDRLKALEELTAQAQELKMGY